MDVSGRLHNPTTLPKEIAAGTIVKTDETHSWVEMVDSKNIFPNAESLSPFVQS